MGRMGLTGTREAARTPEFPPFRVYCQTPFAVLTRGRIRGHHTAFNPTLSNIPLDAIVASIFHNFIPTIFCSYDCLSSLSLHTTLLHSNNTWYQRIRNSRRPIIPLLSKPQPQLLILLLHPHYNPKRKHHCIWHTTVFPNTLPNTDSLSSKSPWYHASNKWRTN